MASSPKSTDGDKTAAAAAATATAPVAPAAASAPAPASASSPSPGPAAASSPSPATVPAPVSAPSPSPGPAYAPSSSLSPPPPPPPPSAGADAGAGPGTGPAYHFAPPDDDNDSAYDDDALSSYATSLASSIRQYRLENGRRYHSFREGEYNFPNDEAEQRRMDLLHHANLVSMDGELAWAPLPEGAAHRVLDLGTGTGTWAVEFADSHPEAKVIANDLSPIQPEWVPPNVHFEIDDMESEWPPRAPFSYIHGRSLLASISDWPRLVRQCYDNLEPGGWVEFQDYHVQTYSEDGTVEADVGNKFVEATTLMDQCLRKVGKECNPGRKLEGWVRDAGFVNVTHVMIKYPLGPWPRDPKQKQIGALFLLNWLDGLEATMLALLTRIEGWTYDEVQVFLALARQDLRKKGIHAMHEFHVVYGQRPPVPAAPSPSPPAQ